MPSDKFDELLDNYIQKEFKDINGYDTIIGNVHLPLKQLILCDRYNKGEPVTRGIDFDVVRNALHKFNTRNLLEFFGQVEFAFLFMYYYEKQGEIDAQEQKDVDSTKLISEMEALYEEAGKYVPRRDDVDV